MKHFGVMHEVGPLKRIWIWCRRFRHRCGYGVHSPFAFNLITWVIYEKYSFYPYQELDKLRSRLIKDGEKKLLNSSKVDKLLFRLVNWMQPQEILEIGTQTGLSTCYMASAKRDARITTISSGNIIVPEEGYSNIKKYKVNSKNSENVISDYLERISLLDFVHFNRYTPERVIYKKIYPKIHRRSLLVIEGIHSSKAMLEWWNELIKDERTGITFDLYEIGLIFYDKTKIKQHYVVNF